MAGTAKDRDEARAKSRFDAAAALELTGVSTACLLRYERACIAVPERVGRRRFYRREDLRRIRAARRLEQDLGVNLAGVEIVLRLTEQIGELQRRISVYEAQTR